VFWKRSVFCTGLAILVTLSLSGCGGGSKPVSVAVTASATTVDATDSVTLTAAVANDKNGAGVSWSVSGGGTLSNQTATSATYTAPSTNTSSLSATVTATSVADATKTGSAALTVPATPTITTAALAAATVGTAYSATLAGSGGITPYTWSVSSGTLPSGLSLAASTGAISGTPLAAAVGTASLTFKLTDSGKATALTITKALSLTVNPGTPTLAFAAISAKTYGDAPFTVSASSASSGVITYSVTSGPATIAGNTVTLTGAGTVVLGASQAATDSYTAATASTSFKVNPETPTLTFTTVSTKTFGDAPFTVSASSASSGAITYSVTSGPATIAGNAVTLTGGGTVVLGASQAANGNYGAATASTSFTVNPETATLTFATIPTKTLGDAPFTVSANSASNGAITYSVTSGPATIAGNTVTLNGAGSVVLGASQAATESYTAATTSTSFTVNPGTPTLTFAAIPAQNYGVAPFTVSASSASNGAITYSVTSGPATIAGNTVTLTGTGTVVLGASQSATTNYNSATASISFTVNPPAALLLTPSLPAATSGQNYTGTISASGGIYPYTWMVNGTPVVINGSNVSLSNGTLYATSTGSGTSLTIGGTPSSTSAVTLDVSVTDSAGTPVTVSNNYSITVNAAGEQVSGYIYLTNYCGTPTVPAITVSINTTPVQTATTDGSGYYSFANVPNGSYTITPSITGPSAAFYPATQSVTVNNGTVNVTPFNAALGYTVSGTVSYFGSKTGRTYLVLSNTSCSGNNGPGTSIPSIAATGRGTYAIRGVPPGTYTVNAWMDSLGYGFTNASDPSGSSSSLTISSADASGADVTLTDASTITLSTAPKIQAAFPFNQGATLFFKPILNNNGVELPTSYTVQWSTDSSFGTVAGTKSFKATGDDKDAWILSGLTNSQLYYFRAQGVVGSSTSNWSAAVSATIGAPSTGNTVSGTITFTGTATGPLFVGYMDQTAQVMYGTFIANPQSPAAYSVKVPTGSNYFFFGIIDQNNDGMIDAGDITNVNDNSTTVVAITGDTTKNLTLPSAGATATVTTQHWQQTGSNTGYGYSLNLETREAIKLPVAATIVSGPNVAYPLDLGVCTYCGTPQFYTNISINTVRPSTSDTYGILVIYGDGTSETLTAKVSAVLDAFPTNLAPTTGTSSSTTPTFSWADPSNASSYVYVFSINDNNGNEVWQVPSNNSKSNGLPSTITSLVWPTDPTDSTNTAPSSLSTSTSYNWQVQAIDSNGNSAMTQVSYQP